MMPKAKIIIDSKINFIKFCLKQTITTKAKANTQKKDGKT